MRVSRLPRHFLARYAVIPALIFAFAIPFPSYARDPRTPIGVMTNDDAQIFAKELIKRVKADQKPGEKMYVNIVHIDGRDNDPRFEIIASMLADEDIHIVGSIITREDYDKAANQYQPGGRFADTENVFLVKYQEMTGKALSAEERDRTRGFFGGLKARFTSLKEKVFGLRHGVRIFSPFYEKTRTGEKRYPATWGDFFFASFTSLWAITNLNLVRMYAPDFFGTPAQPVTTGFVLLNTFLFGWIYYTLYRQQALAKVRTQGTDVVMDRRLPDGEQIGTKPNQMTLTAAVLGQEQILAGTLFGILAAAGDAPVAMSVYLGNFVLNGLLSAYAAIAPESVRAEWLRKRSECQQLAKKLAAAHGDPKEVEKLLAEAKWANRKAIGLGLFFWNVLFPTFKNLQMFIPSFLAAAPFMLLGSVGFIFKYAGQTLFGRRRNWYEQCHTILSNLGRDFRKDVALKALDRLQKKDTLFTAELHERVKALVDKLDPLKADSLTTVLGELDLIHENEHATLAETEEHMRKFYDILRGAVASNAPEAEDLPKRPDCGDFLISW